MTLADRVAAATLGPVPAIGPFRRLWLVGSGPFHDAAELGTFPFAGSGRSAAVVSGDGHARLGNLLGPQDACVLIGGDADLQAYAERVAGGVGAATTMLDPSVTAVDDATTTFAIAAANVLALCHALGAPGVADTDLAALPAAITAATDSPAALRGALGERVIVMGSGPAAVTARHLAVGLRRSHPAARVEGLDAQDVVGAAAEKLGPGITLIALDPGRDPDSAVFRVAKMARVEGARVIEVPGDPTLGPVAAQLPLAVVTASRAG